jgi:hypothetical protein
MRRPVAVFEMLCVRACMPCSESLGELFAARGASGVIPPSLRRQASVRPPCCRRRDRVPRGADSYTIRYDLGYDPKSDDLQSMSGIKKTGIWEGGTVS